MSSAELPQEREINLRALEKSLRRPRSFINFALCALVTLLTLAAAFPLFSVLYMLVVRGGERISTELFTGLPPTAFDIGGGFGNAILGTFMIVGIATVISVPIGILCGIFLAEISPDSKLAAAVRFAAKLLTGFPSILAGVFAYGAIVLIFGGFSAFAGGIAIAVLMLPTIMLTTEEAIRMVPDPMRQAAIGMGTTRTQTVTKVLLPTAMPGILTGIMLAIARGAGETAPLLFTALFSRFWNTDPTQPTASLAVLIYNFSSSAFDNQIQLAWAAALVLVFLVLVVNLLGRSFSRQQIRR